MYVLQNVKSFKKHHFVIFNVKCTWLYKNHFLLVKIIFNTFAFKMTNQLLNLDNFYCILINSNTQKYVYTKDLDLNI